MQHPTWRPKVSWRCLHDGHAAPVVSQPDDLLRPDRLQVLQQRIVRCSAERTVVDHRTAVTAVTASAISATFRSRYRSPATASATGDGLDPRQREPLAQLLRFVLERRVGGSRAVASGREEGLAVGSGFGMMWVCPGLMLLVVKVMMRLVVIESRDLHVLNLFTRVAALIY